MVNERSGASLGHVFHLICTVHASGFVKCGGDGLEQLRIDDRSTKVSDQFLFEDFLEPRRKFRVQSAKVESWKRAITNESTKPDHRTEQSMK